MPEEVANSAIPSVLVPLPDCSLYESSFAAGEEVVIYATSDDPNETSIDEQPPQRSPSPEQTEEPPDNSRTLFGAVYCANQNTTTDAIRLTSRTYTARANYAMNGNTGYAITSDIVIRGINAPLTTIDAGVALCDANAQALRHFYVGTEGQLTLESLSLDNGCTNGTADAGRGGALYNTGAVTFTSLASYDNHAVADGGAIYNTGTVTGAIAEMGSNESQTRGGAVYNAGSLNLTDALLLQQNRADLEGASLYNVGDARLNGVVLREHDNLATSPLLATSTTATTVLRDIAAEPQTQSGTLLHNRGTLTIDTGSFIHDGSTAVRYLTNDGQAILSNISLARTQQALQNTGDLLLLHGSIAADTGNALDNSGQATIYNSYVDSVGCTNTATLTGANNLATGTGCPTSAGFTPTSFIGIGTLPTESGLQAIPITATGDAFAGGSAQWLEETTLNADLNADGDTADTLSEDGRGSARVALLRPDIGAYEIVCPTVAAITQADLLAPLDACSQTTNQRVQVTLRNDITLTTPLPTFNGLIDLVGQGYAIERAAGAPAFRLLDFGTSATWNLDDLTLQNGAAGAGDGGAIRNAGTLTLEGVNLYNNTATNGGAVASTGSLDIYRVDARANQATQDGGALWVVPQDSTRSYLLMSNLTGNVAGNNGGGIFVGDEVSMTRLTVSGNRAANAGGGITASIYDDRIWALRVLVWGNTAPQDPQMSSIPDVRLSGVEGGYPGEENLTLNPTDDLFVNPVDAANAPTQGGDYHLVDSSLAIDYPYRLPEPTSPQAISNYEIDIDGDPRTYGAAEDLGADENLNACELAYPNLTASGYNEYRIAAICAGLQDFPVTITLTDDIFMRGFIPLSGTITLEGQNHTIFGQYDYQGMTVTSEGVVTARDLTIQNGQARISYRFPTDRGGAIASQGILTLERVTMLNNKSESHGGSIFVNDGEVYIYDSLIDDSYSGSAGGGLYIYEGRAVVVGTTFSRNEARNGAAIYIRDAETIIANSLIADNTSFTDSGIGILGDLPLTVVNTTFSTNAGGSGAINQTGFSATTTIYNSTFYNNDSSAPIDNPNADIFNSIIVHNSNDQCPFVRAMANTLTNLDCPDLPGFIQSNNLDLRLLEDNGGLVRTHAIGASSDAVDAGDNTVLPDEASLNVDINRDGDTDDALTTDARGVGFPRIVGDVVDVGAFESDQVPDADVCETYEATYSAGDTVLVSTYTALANAIECANANATADNIRLQSDISAPVFTLWENAPTAFPIITSEVRIDGNGYTIDRNAAATRFFGVDSNGSLMLARIYLKKGSLNNFNQDGAAIYNAGTVLIASSELSENTTQYGNGGAIYNTGTLDVHSSTFINNKARTTTFAAPIGMGAIYNAGGTVNVTNSLLWANADEQLNAGTVTHTAVQWGYPGVGNIELEASTTHRRDDVTRVIIDAGQAAALPPDVLDLDADGDTTEPLSLDLAGNPRIQSDGLDMGAIEYAGLVESGVCDPHFAQWDMNRAYASGSDPIKLAGTIHCLNHTDGTDKPIIYLRYDITFDKPYITGQTTALPVVEVPFRLAGGGNIVRRADDAPPFRLLAVDITRNPNNLTPQIYQITFENGYIDSTDNTNLPHIGEGGAIAIYGASTLTMDAVTFRNNQAVRGGAIGAGYVNGAGQTTLSIMRGTFEQNTATEHGGAIYGTLSGSDLTFMENSAAIDGGAIAGSKWAFDNTTQLPPTQLFRDVAFTGNAAGRDGGAIATEWADAAFAIAQFTSNTAGRNGGAVYHQSKTDASYTEQQQFQLVAFVGNAASGSGAALYADVASGATGSDVSLVNSVVTGNASATGGAVDLIQATAATILSSTIASNSNAGVVGGDAVQALHNSVVTNNETLSTFAAEAVQYTAIRGWAAGGIGNIALADTDLVFVDAQSPLAAPTTVGDYRLASFSVLRGAGNPALVPTDAFDVDQNGDTTEALPLDIALNPRFNGIYIDIGAYEMLITSDINGDGRTTPVDSVFVINRLGETNIYADVNQDGVVDETDLQIVLEALGP